MGKMEKVSVSQVLEDLAELYDPSCEAEDLGFEADIKQNLVINADRSLIIQAVANLLDNAVKYTPSGGKVALGARKKSGEVEIYVADNGPGVPAEDRHKVLERFYRMESARTEPGSGLGLALVAAVADMHQGRLELTDGTPNDTGVGLRVSLIFRAA